MNLDIFKISAREIGLILSNENIKSFELFAAELIKWNRRVNLTGITRENEIAVKHFLDSLSLASYILDDDLLLDIGSGAGLPVIPLKIVKPETLMFSVDAVAKKINFQRHVIRLLGLSKIETLHSRVECLYERYPKKFNIITSRAFSQLDHFVALAKPLLAKNGRLIAMKGAEAEVEIAASTNKLWELGFVVEAAQRYILPCNMGMRSLVVVKSLQNPLK